MKKYLDITNKTQLELFLKSILEGYCDGIDLEEIEIGFWFFYDNANNSVESNLIVIMKTFEITGFLIYPEE